jgi:hypothetical protein
MMLSRPEFIERRVFAHAMRVYHCFAFAQVRLRGRCSRYITPLAIAGVWNGACPTAA